MTTAIKEKDKNFFATNDDGKIYFFENAIPFITKENHSLLKPFCFFPAPLFIKGLEKFIFSDGFYVASEKVFASFRKININDVASMFDDIKNNSFLFPYLFKEELKCFIKEILDNFSEKEKGNKKEFEIFFEKLLEHYGYKEDADKKNIFLMDESGKIIFAKEIKDGPFHYFSPHPFFCDTEKEFTFFTAGHFQKEDLVFFKELNFNELMFLFSWIKKDSPLFQKEFKEGLKEFFLAIAGQLKKKDPGIKKFSEKISEYFKL